MRSCRHLIRQNFLLKLQAVGGGFTGISFSNIGTVGREQLITSGSNGEPNWSYIPSKGKSTKKANNRTYQFADEKTKKQIAYMSGYYLQTVPQSVKAAWQETLEETGFNPFQTDVTSILTQLSVEQDFLTGGDDNIFGETKESYYADNLSQLLISVKIS